MISNITHANGTMTCTTKTGETATRKTSNAYKAAIVGRDAAGKLVVCFAGWSEQKAADALAQHQAGKFVNHKFSGVTDVELVTVAGAWESEAPDAWMGRDDALVAAHRARAA